MATDFFFNIFSCIVASVIDYTGKLTLSLTLKLYQKMTEKEIDVALEWLNDLEEQIEDYCEFPEVQDLDDEDIERLKKLRLRRDFLNDILVKGTENCVN